MKKKVKNNFKVSPFLVSKSQIIDRSNMDQKNSENALDYEPSTFS